MFVPVPGQTVLTELTDNVISGRLLTVNVNDGDTFEHEVVLPSVTV